MTSSIPKMRFAVVESCSVSPLTIARIASACGSEISSRGVIGPTGQNGVGRLPARPLPVRELEVARADVVRAEVSAHRLERVLLRHALDSRADHDAELGLVVGLRHDRRDRRSPRPGRSATIGHFAKRSGSAGSSAPCSSAWSRVVQADADDLSRTLDRQHGQKPTSVATMARALPRAGWRRSDLRHAALDSIV